jgi:hypothetical protein
MVFVITFEGTHNIPPLIIGERVTGLPAYKEGFGMGSPAQRSIVSEHLKRSTTARRER